jgi:hypothetical protein
MITRVFTLCIHLISCFLVSVCIVFLICFYFPFLFSVSQSIIVYFHFPFSSLFYSSIFLYFPLPGSFSLSYFALVIFIFLLFLSFCLFISFISEDYDSPTYYVSCIRLCLCYNRTFTIRLACFYLASGRGIYSKNRRSLNENRK